MYGCAYRGKLTFPEFRLIITLSQHIQWQMYGIRTANSLDSEKIRDAIEGANDVELYTDKHFTVDPATHNPLNKMVAIIEVKNGEYNLRDTFYPSMME